MFAIGSIVEQPGLVNTDGSMAQFEVVDYWRGQPRLRSLTTDTTHVAPERDLVLISGSRVAGETLSGSEWAKSEGLDFHPPQAA